MSLDLDEQLPDEIKNYNAKALAIKGQLEKKAPALKWHVTVIDEYGYFSGWPLHLMARGVFEIQAIIKVNDARLVGRIEITEECILQAYRGLDILVEQMAAELTSAILRWKGGKDA